MNEPIIKEICRKILKSLAFIGTLLGKILACVVGIPIAIVCLLVWGVWRLVLWIPSLMSGIWKSALGVAGVAAVVVTILGADFKKVEDNIIVARTFLSNFFGLESR